MTTATKTKTFPVKTAADRAFERKVERIARAVAKLSDEANSLHHEAHDLGLADEQVGSLMWARETLQKAAARYRASARDVKPNI